MEDQSLILLAITVAIIVGLTVLVIYLYKKNQLVSEQLKKKQTDAHKIGVNQTKCIFRLPKTSVGSFTFFVAVEPYMLL